MEGTAQEAPPEMKKNEEASKNRVGYQEDLLEIKETIECLQIMWELTGEWDVLI